LSLCVCGSQSSCRFCGAVFRDGAAATDGHQLPVSASVRKTGLPQAFGELGEIVRSTKGKHFVQIRDA